MAKASSISRDLAAAISPVAFARSLGFPNLDKWQRDLLMATDRYVCICASRQVGKTTLVSILALHHSLTHPNALVLVVSPSQRQSGELFRKVSHFFADLGKPVPPEQENVYTLTLRNGSRIVSLPGQNPDLVRSFSAPSLIIIDEAARASDELFYGAIRPMLAASQKGRLILLSTPAGQRGFFWKTVTEEEGWRKFTVTADQCPRISAEFLAQEKRELGTHYFRQEYYAEFFARDDAVFDPALIKAAFRSDVNEWDLDLDLDDDAESPEDSESPAADHAADWDLDLDSDYL